MPSRAWKVVLSLTVSGLALFLVFRHVKVGDLAHALASARPIWFVPAVTCFLVLFGLRARRWAALLGETPFWPTFQALVIGYMMNATLPLRAGEVGRALVVSQRTRRPIAQVMSSVIVERVLDLASVVLLFAAFARLAPIPASLSHAASLTAIGLVLGVLAGALLLAKADAAERAIRPRLARIGLGSDKTWQRVRELRDGFRAVRSWRGLVKVLALTAAIWALTILLAYFAMAAFLAPTGASAGLVVVASNLAGALPSAPGGLGVVQGFAEMALVVPFGVPQDRALAYVFVWSLGQQLSLVLLGVFALSRVGISLRQAQAPAEPSKAP